MALWWKWGAFGAVFILVGWGFFGLMNGRKELKTDISEMSAQLSGLRAENRDLSDKIKYFENPANLVNELKKQTNYRLPDEKLIIIVPGAAASSTTSTDKK